MENIEQGSPEWLAIRKTKITSTDMVVLMGHHEYGMTPSKLWKLKKGLIPEFTSNAAMARGTEVEPEARRWYEEVHNSKMEPRCVFKDDFMMSSLDGLSLDGKLVLEIKCPGEKTIQKYNREGASKAWITQCQWHMLVANASYCDLIVYDGFDGTVEMIHKDASLHEEMIERARSFWESLQNDQPPIDDEDMITVEIDLLQRDLFERYFECQSKLKSLETLEKALKREITDLSDDGNVEFMDEDGRSVAKLVRVQRKGATDWGAICNELSISDDLIKKHTKKEIGYVKLVKS
jgi:putative phage-type endonuclease